MDDLASTAMAENVRAKADAVDFSGFRQLLTNLVEVINAHKTTVGTY